MSKCAVGGQEHRLRVTRRAGSLWSGELAVLSVRTCFSHTENSLLEEPTGLQSNLLPQLTVRVFLPCSYYPGGNRCSGATPHLPSPSPQTPCCLDTTGVHLPSLSADQAPILSLALLSTALVTGSRQHSPAPPSSCFRFSRSPINCTATTCIHVSSCPQEKRWFVSSPDV